MVKKLMNKKKNNKGFSLVELIVVVLIIAIIAVALAPQVMKWVGSARTNTDANNRATIKSAVAVAVADYQSQGGTNCTWTDTIESGSFTPAPTGLSMATCIFEVLNGDYPLTSAGTPFTVTITTTGSITVTP